MSLHRPSLFLGLIFTLLLQVCTGHMAYYDPSAYGYNEDKGLIHEPLANLPFSKWWFRGYANQNPPPSGITTITAGQPLTLGISCRKTYSKFGATPDPVVACPMDAGAYHAGGQSFNPVGWEGNLESNLMGCALAIAPKATAAETKPGDFVVVSVLEKCVRQHDTTFQIPTNLPECPDGECTCAWFWQGMNSQLEMYMSSFRCKVEGGVASPWPKPVEPRKGAIRGPTQPMYWAQAEGNNMPEYPGIRPSYNSKFGWSDGAQTSAFGVAGGSGDGGKTSKAVPEVAKPTGTSLVVAGSPKPAPAVNPAKSSEVTPAPLPATSTSTCRRSRQTDHSSKRHQRPCDHPIAS